MDAKIGAEYKGIAAAALSGFHTALIHAEQNGEMDLRPLELVRLRLLGQYQGLDTCERLARRSVEEIEYNIGFCPFDAEAHAEDVRSDEQQEEYRRLFRSGT